jgi:hypothetical protein
LWVVGGGLRVVANGRAFNRGDIVGYAVVECSLGAGV